MKNQFFVLVILFSISISSIKAQENIGGGINLSYITNYNRLQLTKNSQFTSADNTLIIYRSPEIFPDEYLSAFQFGFVNHKKTWHDFRFSFVFMPKTEKIYKEFKLDGEAWQFFENPDQYEKINMEMYMMNIAHIFKINLAAHHLYLNFGLAAGGGVIRWPSYNNEGTDYYLLSYYGYPIGGIEVLFGKHIGLNAEYHYQWGKSVSQSMSITGGKATWEYELLGHEICLGFNFYF